MNVKFSLSTNGETSVFKFQDWQKQGYDLIRTPFHASMEHLKKLLQWKNAYTSQITLDLQVRKECLSKADQFFKKISSENFSIKDYGIFSNSLILFILFKDFSFSLEKGNEWMMNALEEILPRIRLFQDIASLDLFSQSINTKAEQIELVNKIIKIAIDNEIRVIDIEGFIYLDNYYRSLFENKEPCVYIAINEYHETFFTRKEKKYNDIILYLNQDVISSIFAKNIKLIATLDFNEKIGSFTQEITSSVNSKQNNEIAKVKLITYNPQSPSYCFDLVISEILKRLDKKEIQTSFDLNLEIAGFKKPWEYISLFKLINKFDVIDFETIKLIVKVSRLINNYLLFYSIEEVFNENEFWSLIKLKSDLEVLQKIFSVFDENFDYSRFRFNTFYVFLLFINKTKCLGFERNKKLISHFFNRIISIAQSKLMENMIQSLPNGSLSVGQSQVFIVIYDLFESQEKVNFLVSKNEYSNLIKVFPELWNFFQENSSEGISDEIRSHLYPQWESFIESLINQPNEAKRKMALSSFISHSWQKIQPHNKLLGKFYLYQILTNEYPSLQFLSSFSEETACLLQIKKIVIILDLVVFYQNRYFQFIDKFISLLNVHVDHMQLLVSLVMFHFPKNESLNSDDSLSDLSQLVKIFQLIPNDKKTEFVNFWKTKEQEIKHYTSIIEFLTLFSKEGILLNTIEFGVLFYELLTQVNDLTILKGLQTTISLLPPEKKSVFLEKIIYDKCIPTKIDAFVAWNELLQNKNLEELDGSQILSLLNFNELIPDIIDIKEFFKTHQLDHRFYLKMKSLSTFINKEDLKAFIESFYQLHLIYPNTRIVLLLALVPADRRINTCISLVDLIKNCSNSTKIHCGELLPFLSLEDLKSIIDLDFKGTLPELMLEHTFIKEKISIHTLSIFDQFINNAQHMMVLSKYIIQNFHQIGLVEDSDLVLKAVEINSVVNPQEINNPKNPYKVHQFIAEKLKMDQLIPFVSEGEKILGLDPNISFGINIEGFRALIKERYTTDMLPKTVSEQSFIKLCGNFTDRINTLETKKKEALLKYMKDSYEKNFFEMFDFIKANPYLYVKVLRIPRSGNQVIDRTVYYAHEILEWIQNSNTGINENLSEQESRLMFFLSFLQYCGEGQKEGIYKFYHQVFSLSGHLSEDKQKKILDFVADIVFIAQTDTIANPILHQRLGHDSNMEQLIHSSKFLKNLYHEQIGYPHTGSLDLFTRTIPDSYFKLDTRFVLKTFYQICSCQFFFNKAMERVELSFKSKGAGGLTFMDILGFLESIGLNTGEGWVYHYIVFNDNFVPIGITALCAKTVFSFANLIVEVSKGDMHTLLQDKDLDNNYQHINKKHKSDN